MDDPVLEVLDLRCGVQLRRGADDAHRLLKRKTGLLAIGGGADDLAGGYAFGSERVQKRERGAETGFPIAASDLQVHDAGTVTLIGNLQIK